MLAGNTGNLHHAGKNNCSSSIQLSRLVFLNYKAMSSFESAEGFGVVC